MRPLCPLDDIEVSRLGAMSPEDFAGEGVPERLVPFVWGVAQALLEARKCRTKFHADRQEATGLGEHASWGRRGDGCDPVTYLVRNVRKAVVREDKSARSRSRPRDFLRAADNEILELMLTEDPPHWVPRDLWPEPDETIDEFIARFTQECRRYTYDRNRVYTHERNRV